LDQLKTLFQEFIFDILGLQDEAQGGGDSATLDGLMQLIIEMRADARQRKDWPTSDKIRDTLKDRHIQLKDSKEGTAWVKE
jgi:cysteinyl-tRNA synthetase